jgi:hypothetical protein
MLCLGCQQSASSTAGAKQAKGSGVQSGGVVQNVRQAVKRAADTEDLKNFALAYFHYVTLNNRGPAGVQDIQDSLPAKMVEALKDDSVYVVIWNIRNPTSETIVAYAAEPEASGQRLVAKGDGSVTRMSQEDFEKAKTKR